MHELFQELSIDNFAGGGGASQGYFQATGRHIDIAINHDQNAIDMHTMNHPTTQHHKESVWNINPLEVTNGLPVSFAWFSPDCKYFSKAKGGKPVEKSIRGLAWVKVKWGATAKPSVMYLENVEEFKTWGPLLPNGMPCKERKGETFTAFVKELTRLGYQVETRELRACDFGAPTTRKRLFMVSRRDGRKIVWPKPTHGEPNSIGVKNGKLKPYRTAGSCIDFSKPCHTIFGRPKSLAEKTLARIANGIQRFVIDTDTPFIVQDQSIFITEHANGSNQRNMSANQPLRTICAQPKGGAFAVCSSHIIKMRRHCLGQSVNEPLHTITAGGNHYGEVRAALIKYYGNDKHGCSLHDPLHTVRTSDCFGLSTIKCVKPPLSDDQLYQAWWCARFMEQYLPKTASRMNQPRKPFITVDGGIMVDILMRMLEPRELFNASSFPADYIIDVDPNGKKISKAKQVERCGNAVPPIFTESLIRANQPELCIDQKVQAA
jgi:DNA (cytosine-5)-methyltransferase 1